MIVCVPTPAVAGLKFPPLTPGPLYVPPVGVPPVSAKGAVLVHVEEFDGQVAVGGALTVIVNVQLLVQPPVVTE